MDRSDRIRTIFEDYALRLAAGEAVSRDDIITEHPDLMPELGDELARTEAIVTARQLAERAPTPDLKRHKGPVAIVTVFMLLVAGSAIGMGILWKNATDQREAAEQARGEEKQQRVEAEWQAYLLGLRVAQDAVRTDDPTMLAECTSAMPAQLKNWEAWHLSGYLDTEIVCGSAPGPAGAGEAYTGQISGEQLEIINSGGRKIMVAGIPPLSANILSDGWHTVVKDTAKVTAAWLDEKKTRGVVGLLTYEEWGPRPVALEYRLVGFNVASDGEARFDWQSPSLEREAKLICYSEGLGAAAHSDDEQLSLYYPASDTLRLLGRLPFPPVSIEIDSTRRIVRTIGSTGQVACWDISASARRWGRQYVQSEILHDCLCGPIGCAVLKEPNELVILYQGQYISDKYLVGYSFDLDGHIQYENAQAMLMENIKYFGSTPDHQQLLGLSVADDSETLLVWDRATGKLISDTSESPPTETGRDGASVMIRLGGKLLGTALPIELNHRASHPVSATDRVLVANSPRIEIRDRSGRLVMPLEPGVAATSGVGWSLDGIWAYAISSDNSDPFDPSLGVYMWSSKGWREERPSSAPLPTAP